MNDTELTIIGLIKLNNERPSFGNEPLFSQVCKMYENGFVFKWSIMSVFYSLWTRKNEKEAFINHDGEIKGRESIHFANRMVVWHHLWTWHLFAFHLVNWVFNLLPSRFSFMIHVTPLIISKNASSTVALCFGILLVKSMVPSLRSCRPMFKGKSYWESAFAVKKKIPVTFEWFLWLHHTQN